MISSADPVQVFVQSHPMPHKGERWLFLRGFLTISLTWLGSSKEPSELTRVSFVLCWEAGAWEPQQLPAGHQIHEPIAPRATAFPFPNFLPESPAKRTRKELLYQFCENLNFLGNTQKRIKHLLKTLHHFYLYLLKPPFSVPAQAQTYKQIAVQ